jgi:hypothetical protein
LRYLKKTTTTQIYFLCDSLSLISFSFFELATGGAVVVRRHIKKEFLCHFKKCIIIIIIMMAVAVRISNLQGIFYSCWINNFYFIVSPSFIINVKWRMGFDARKKIIHTVIISPLHFIFYCQLEAWSLKLNINLFLVYPILIISIRNEWKNVYDKCLSINQNKKRKFRFSLSFSLTKKIAALLNWLQIFLGNLLFFIFQEKKEEIKFSRVSLALFSLLLILFVVCVCECGRKNERRKK